MSPSCVCIHSTTSCNHLLLPYNQRHDAQSNQVELVILPDPTIGDALKAGDDAEDAFWFTWEKVTELREQGVVSADHFDYTNHAFVALTNSSIPR